MISTENSESPLTTEVNVSNPEEERQTGLQTEETTLLTASKDQQDSGVQQSGVGNTKQGKLSDKITPDGQAFTDSKQPLQDDEVAKLEHQKNDDDSEWNSFVDKRVNPLPKEWTTFENNVPQVTWRNPFEDNDKPVGVQDAGTPPVEETPESPLLKTKEQLEDWEIELENSAKPLKVQTEEPTLPSSQSTDGKSVSGQEETTHSASSTNPLVALTDPNVLQSTDTADMYWQPPLLNDSEYIALLTKAESVLGYEVGGLEEAYKELVDQFHQNFDALQGVGQLPEEAQRYNFVEASDLIMNLPSVIFLAPSDATQHSPLTKSLLIAHRQGYLNKKNLKDAFIFRGAPGTGMNCLLYSLEQLSKKAGLIPPAIEDVRNQLVMAGLAADGEPIDAKGITCEAIARQYRVRLTVLVQYGDRYTANPPVGRAGDPEVYVHLDPTGKGHFTPLFPKSPSVLLTESPSNAEVDTQEVSFNSWFPGSSDDKKNNVSPQRDGGVSSEKGFTFATNETVVSASSVLLTESPSNAEVDTIELNNSVKLGRQTEETTPPSSQYVGGKLGGGQDARTFPRLEAQRKKDLEQRKNTALKEAEALLKEVETEYLLGHPVTSLSLEDAYTKLREKVRKAVSDGEKLESDFIERAADLFVKLRSFRNESTMSGVEPHSPLTKRLIDDTNSLDGLTKETLEKSFDFGTASPAGKNSLLDTLKTLSEKLNLTPPATMVVQARLEAAGLVEEDKIFYSRGALDEAIACQYGVRFTYILHNNGNDYRAYSPAGKPGDPEVYVMPRKEKEGWVYTPLFPKSLFVPAGGGKKEGGSKKTVRFSEPLIMGGRDLLLRQRGKENKVPPQQDSGVQQNGKETKVLPQQDSGVPNKDQFALSTEEQLDSLFDIFDSLPAKQKAEAEQKIDQLITSMKACKSDDERKTVLQNAIASMQELVSQMPAASQPGMREKLSKLSNSLGEIKNATVKGDEKPDATSDVDDDKKPDAPSKSGGNGGPEKKAPSLESMSFSDMKKMSKEELLEQQQQQSWEAMMIQIVLTNMQILTEIVKKGTSIAAGAIQ